MGLRVANTLVIATLILARAPSPGAEQQQLVSITDPDAYAVYAAVVRQVRQAWVRVSKDMLLLQQETEGIDAVASCLSRLATAEPDPEWAATAHNFMQENAYVRALQPMLRIDIPYRLIPQAEILADDARLALKYPDVPEHRPESMEYVAVSAVGFNPSKTKAMLYVRRRDSGGTVSMELQDGNWVPVNRGGCVWIS